MAQSKVNGNFVDCSTDNISLHLKNIFKENELDENSVTEEFSVTAQTVRPIKPNIIIMDKAEKDIFRLRKSGDKTPLKIKLTGQNQVDLPCENS